jgi:hypothetical protein
LGHEHRTSLPADFCREYLRGEETARHKHEYVELEKRDAYLSIDSLCVYILLEQSAATAIVDRRMDSGFQRETYLGHEAAIPLPEIECHRALADLYEHVEFPPAVSNDELTEVKTKSLFQHQVADSMTANQMIELMNRTPFEPLEVHLSDGAQIRVEEPWQISTSRNSPVCVIFDVDDRMRIVAYRNITEVVTSPSVNE